jgi:hypothetical protein
MAAQRTRNAQTQQARQLVCPECGRAFSRPQGLGAHRRQAHGIAGTSAAASRRRANADGGRARRATARSTAASAGAAATRAATGAASGRRPRNQSRRSEGPQTVDRDALLQALFPNGIPAREDVIRAVNNWLDEAERLAGTR